MIVFRTKLKAKLKIQNTDQDGGMLWQMELAVVFSRLGVKDLEQAFRISYNWVYV